MNHTSSSETLFSLLRAALGNEAVGALPSDIDWQEVIDLSFDQGVAAIAVDGLGFAHDNDGSLRQAHQPRMRVLALLTLRSWRI